MGALAKMVKSAEEKLAAEETFFATPEPQLGGKRGELMKSFSALLQRVQRNPYKDLQRLSQYMPTSGQEAFGTAAKYTGYIGGAGAGLSFLAALLGHLQAVRRRNDLMGSIFQTGRVPGREMRVPFKFAADDEGMEKKGWLGTAALIGSLVGLPMAWNWGKKQVSKLPTVWKELFTPTSNPLTHPAALPLMLGGGVALTAGSYSLFNHLFKKMRERRRKREMEAAEADFNKALRAQYESPKAASMGEAIDGLAEAYATGELQQQLQSLEKSAQESNDPTQKAPWYRGLGSGATGLYITLALMLALGGGMGAYSLAKKRDTSRRRAQALERALRRRALASPPQFIAEKPDELSEEPI